MKGYEDANGRWPGSGKRAYVVAMGLLLLLGLFACGALLAWATTAVPQTISAIRQGATAAESGTATAVDPTPTPIIGLSRSQPHPPGSTVILPGWEVTLLEPPIRGAQAWAMLQDANWFNTPPPEGYEYLLLNLRVVHRQASDKERYLALHVTGTANVVHYSFHNNQVPPGPILETWLPGQTASEGWNAYTIQQGEQNLLLLIQDMEDYRQPIHYLALTDEAPLQIFTPGLAGVTRTEIGADLHQPASVGQITISANWEAQLLQVVRGAEAWQRMVAANRFNKPPEEGFEFVLAQVRVRYIGTEEGPHYISRYAQFEVRNWFTEEWQRASGIPPKPELDAALFPGGEVVGWIPLPVATEDASPILRFTPEYRVTSATRYFLLRADGR